MSGSGVVGASVETVAGGSMAWATAGIAVGALVAARSLQFGLAAATKSVDALGAGLTMIGERAERTRAEWEASVSAARDWEDAARGVIDVNARIEVLRRHAPDDLAGEVPDPLAPDGRPPGDLTAWCAATRVTLTRVEGLVRQRTETAVLSVLRHAVDLERPVTAEEAFDRYHRAMADATSRRRTVPPRALADVTRILGRLTPDAAAEDRADVLAAAAQVAVPRPDVDPDTLLDELRLRVQRAGERARTRRADAVVAASALQALPADPDDPDRSGLREELAAVVAARRALDADLRARADAAIARVRAELEHAYLRASVTGTLAELGYRVDEGFATVTASPDRMRLVRDDWDEHAVQVVLDGDQLRAAVIRLEDKVGADARRADVEREEQWCGHLVDLRDALGGSGVRVVERELVPPGARVVPVVKRVERADTRHERTSRERGR